MATGHKNSSGPHPPVSIIHLSSGISDFEDTICVTASPFRAWLCVSFRIIPEKSGVNRYRAFDGFDSTEYSDNDFSRVHIALHALRRQASTNCAITIRIYSFNAAA